MDNRELMKLAIEAKKNAYVPYSKFQVGSAVLMEDGRVSIGCNIEIASYAGTICAERTAIFKAIAESYSNIDKIAIVGDAPNTFPCGICRQVMREFGKNPTIIIGNSEDDFTVYTLSELLPHSFGPEDLENRR